jgi:nucleoside-diphosphate-sugar epimerase
VRAVDVKPVDEWFQVFGEADNRVADLSDRDACREALKGARYVFNLAADMGGMGFIETNKALCMLSVLINTHLLLAAREQGVERYFFASSACVYAADKQTSTDVTPQREADAYPAMPEDGYGWEKLSGDHQIEIWGDGEQTRSFMFVDDCIYGTRMLMESDVTEPLNVGSAQLVTVNELVSIVEEIAGLKLRRRYKLDAPQGVRGRNSDNALIKERLGWEPEITLENGLEKTYAWMYDEMTARGARKDPVLPSGAGV